MDTTAHSEPLPLLEADIQRFETTRFGTLRFAVQSEHRYRRETSLTRGRSLLLQGLLALLAYDFCFVGDYLMAPTHLLRAAITRFAIITPLALIVIAMLRKRRNVRVLESTATLLCLAASISIFYLHHDVSAIVTAEAQAALVLVVLLANCMLRLHLPYAAALTTTVLLLDIVFLATDTLLSPPERWLSGGMFMWVAVLAVTANYMLTREHRLTYLLRQRDRVHRAALADANAELLALSATDRLTGLPNRRAYDARLQELWQKAAAENEPLSAVMIDVDHFKRLNDNHGHAYGDRVLQRVASLLQQALRGEADFVARFGGEEFILLLPGSTPPVALMVAERVRTLVQVAGSPALQRDAPLAPEEMWSTVSCGVSTAWPMGGGEATSLIAEADIALYRAKRSGRNKVCCSAAAAEPAATKVTVFPAYGTR